MKRFVQGRKKQNPLIEICMKILTLVFVLWILSAFCSGKIYAQNNTNEPLKFPWAGGLNSCTFGSIDIDLDGIPDLVIFERFGNRILPFIRNGSAGNIDYSYNSEYTSHFPAFHEWVQFVDYNCDGKNDIFTYYAGGIRVFRNVSATVLKFKRVTDLLLSYYYTGLVGILGTPVDFPVFTDLDNDGDIDILTFFGLGSFVEFHKNLSMEKYGNCDSLDFKLTDNCYGDFKESEGGNKITLDAVCPSKTAPMPGVPQFQGSQKHTGSTLLATDLNGDGVKDLVLGDVDFPNLISMINGGTGDSAHMISIDSTFPGTSRPVRLFSFPSCSSIDMNNDGLNDFVVSPFDPQYLVSDNFRSVWFYKNTGTTSAPFFQFQEDRFFQNEMIDVGTNAYPVLMDINGDGLSDLIIGNYGYYDSSYYYQGILHSAYTSRLAYFENTGTTANPSFKLVTDDFGGFSTLHLTGLYPAFGDLDGDGDFDLILGNTSGTLIYLENTAGPGHLPVYNAPVINYQNINVVNSSSPQLFDLDQDGRLDLIVGKQNGTISYYQNTGSVAQPQFTLVTDFLGKINVTNPNLSYYGYSTPCFFSDKNHEIKLLVGSEEGKVHYFTNIENNLDGTFISSDSLFSLVTGTPFEIQPGWRLSPCIDFVSDPVFMDMIVGNFAGGLNYFSHQSAPPVITDIPGVTGTVINRFKVYPNPADRLIYIKTDVRNPDLHFRLDVYNSMGERVLSQNFNPAFLSEFSTVNLPTGLYLLKISPPEATSGDNRLTMKIVVRH
jgi:hypothetical protein